MREFPGDVALTPTVKGGRAGIIVTLIGLVVALGWLGSLKISNFGDAGTVPIVANSPSMSLASRHPAGEAQQPVNREGGLVPANREWRVGTMKINKDDTALVVIDPQNDVLSEKGVSWGLVGDSVKENNTVANIERLFKAAKEQGFGVFISPHYLYPTDQAWQFGGAVEKMMLEGKEFSRPGPLSLDGFTGSGADWLERYKPFIEDGKTVVVSPHKVYGPQNNDLVLQLRKRHIDKVILAGMMANLCVESHLRDLIEQGIEVAVVKDATAAPRHPVLGDGYKAAVINYGFLANSVLSTDDAVKAMR